MILPRKENLTEKMIIDIMNARFYNEKPIYILNGFEKKYSYELITNIYYGDVISLNQNYTEHVLNVLRKYNIIEEYETVDVLLREGKIRASEAITENLNQILENTTKIVSIIKCNMLITKKVANKKIILN